MAVRVFLAEDNDDLASLVSRRLEARAWSVVRAATAEEAGSRLRGDRFDAVILDYKLPDGNGLELLGILRETAPATPVLFLTAHGSEDIAMQALGLGASDYMVKTGSLLDELPARVAGLLERGGDMRRAATVVAVRAHAPDAPARDDEISLSHETAARLVQEFVKGEVLGAALFDGAGTPIAALLPASLDARALGLALVQVHAQAVIMGRTTRLAPRAYAFTLDTEEGILATSAVPGKALVAVLVKPGARHAADRLEELASRLRERL